MELFFRTMELGFGPGPDPINNFQHRILRRKLTNVTNFSFSDSSVESNSKLEFVYRIGPGVEKIVRIRTFSEDRTDAKSSDGRPIRKMLRPNLRRFGSIPIPTKFTGKITKCQDSVKAGFNIFFFSQTLHLFWCFASKMALLGFFLDSSLI